MYTASLARLSCSTRATQLLQYFNTVFLKILIVPLRTDFADPVTNDWNSLPCDIVTAPNVLSFKANLDKFLYNQCFY